MTVTFNIGKKVKGYGKVKGKYKTLGNKVENVSKHAGEETLSMQWIDNKQTKGRE